jgi:hypothetical protein
MAEMAEKNKINNAIHFMVLKKIKLKPFRM